MVLPEETVIKNTAKSKELRKNQTPWESKVWYYLRKKNFSNLKLREVGKFSVT
jgi:very-short-patch-repair endonuclease